MSRPALSRRADARWWWWCRYAGSSIASPPLALCVRPRRCRSFRLQRCSCTRLDTLHQRGPGRTLARSERGGGVQQGGSVGGCTLVSRGWGQRETLRSHESRAEDCRAPQARCRPNLIRVRPGPTTATSVRRRLYVSAYMRNVLYTRGIASQRLVMRPRRLAYDVLNAVAGDRLEEAHWRRAQSTPKVLASTVYPATLLEISLHRVTIAAWAPKTYEPVADLRLKPCNKSSTACPSRISSYSNVST